MVNKAISATLTEREGWWGVPGVEAWKERRGSRKAPFSRRSMQEGGRVPRGGSGQGRLSPSSSERGVCRGGTSMEMEGRRRSADEQNATENRNLHSFLLASARTALGDHIRRRRRRRIRIRRDFASTYMDAYAPYVLRIRSPA